MKSAYLDPSMEGIKELVLKGKTGLELESLRTDLSGHLSKKPHPLNHELIVRDFCEAQPEINTRAWSDPHKAWNELKETLNEMRQTLIQQDQLVWPFSSPCILEREEDIHIARVGDKGERYRNYLANRYGRRKMTFCGIHFNYSFDDELIDLAFKHSGYSDRANFKNYLYLHTSAWCSRQGWLINALFNASPIMDGSYYEMSLAGSSCFSGLSSQRNSEIGYWNFFTPLFDFSSWQAYIGSIKKTVDTKLLYEARELYYPVRIKTRGPYTIRNMEQEDIDHIELRMIDINPFSIAGIDEKDLEFLRLFVIWCAFRESLPFGWEEQILTIANFKSASRYDLSLATILKVNQAPVTVKQASLDLLNQMKDFFEKLDVDTACIDAQLLKINDPQHHRYAWMVRHMFSEDYVEKGIELAEAYADGIQPSFIPKK